MINLNFDLDPALISWLNQATFEFDRTQVGDKPMLLNPSEPLKPFKYTQFDVSAVADESGLVIAYLIIIREAARLLKRHGRKLGNVWLRAMAYEEQVAFGAHTDPSYITMPICKGGRPSNGQAWYGTLAHHLDGHTPHPHKFNPGKEGPDSVTWVAFVYPALTDLLPDGRAVAQYLNDLETV